jgi:predicted RNA polymerase sigma factor
MNRLDEAATAYTRALELAGNAVEQQFLRRRLKEIGRDQS